MNIDDESQISAFFDDELDPGDRLAVAWSIESSPPLAQQLADLKSTQRLLKRLDRPSIPEDLSGEILAAIAASPKKSRHVVSKRAVRIAAALVGVGGMAASLLLAVSLLHRPLHDFPVNPSPSIALSVDRTDLHHPPLVVAEAPKGSSFTADRPVSTEAPRVAPKAPIIQVAKAKATGVGGPEPARPGQVDAMLGHRKVLRAVIVTDVLDLTSNRVRSFIEGDADREPEFGRITLTQGIVVDPDRPGEAEVYSVVMSEPGCEPFLDRLHRAFPEMELENEAEPTFVTQLTEVGQVAVFSGVRPAKLGLPPEALPGLVAAKADVAPDHFPPPTVVALDPSVPRPVDFAQGRGIAVTKEAGNPTPRISPPVLSRSLGDGRAGSHPTTPPDLEPVTVLVWVTRSSKP